MHKKWYYLYGDYMARRKVKKTTKRRLTVFGTLSVILIFYFIFTLCFQGYNVYKLYNQKNSLKEKYSSLKTKAEDLKIEINQLHDPEYLAKYARENYSYSKEGEYIIKLNDTKEKIDKLDNSINKEYIVIGLSVFLVLIFIYVLKKGNRKK